MSLAFWKKYLIDAGIPVKASSSYAETFVDNRITQDMIPDLSKSVLADLGITIVGDIISILKHAIIITQQMSAQKQLTKKSSKTDKSEKSRSEKPKLEKQNTLAAKKAVSKSAVEDTKYVPRNVTKNVDKTSKPSIQRPVQSATKTMVKPGRKVRVTEQPPEMSPHSSDDEQPPSPKKTTSSKKETSIASRKVSAGNRPRTVDRTHSLSTKVQSKRTVGLVNTQPAQKSISKIIKLGKNGTLKKLSDSLHEQMSDESEEVSDDTYDDSESDPEEEEDTEPLKRRVFGTTSSPPSSPIVTRRAVTHPVTQTVTCVPVTQRLVTATPIQTVRCVSPDSTTSDLRNKPQQVATVILNTKGKCSVRPVSPPADLQVEKRRRTVMARADGKTTLNRVLQRHIADNSPRRSPIRKTVIKPSRKLSLNTPDKRRITAEKFNSFRSDDEIKSHLSNNKFRSESDSFDVVPEKVRRARSLSGSKSPRKVMRRSTPAGFTGRLGSNSHELRSNVSLRCKTLGMSSKVMKLGGVASRLDMFNSGNKSAVKRKIQARGSLRSAEMTHRRVSEPTGTFSSRISNQDKSVFSRLGR